MTARQNAYLQMAAAVKATCDAHPAAWSTFSPFADAYPEFTARLAAADAALALQASATEGATAGKKTLRTALAANLRILSAALVLHGKLTADTRMAADAKTTERMHTNMAEKSYAGHALKLLDMAAALPANTLLPYGGVSAGFLNNTQVALDNFTNAIGTPRHIQSEKVRGGQDLDAVIEDILEIFEERMDPAAEVLAATQPDFYSEYQTSREIVDPGYTVRDLTVTVSDATTGQPISGVQATVAPGGIEKVTGAAGGFYIQDLDAGSYTLALARPGYAPKSVPFAVVDGEGATLEVTMQPAGSSSNPPAL